MPTVFRYRSIRFYFFSNEGSPLEPVHIHAAAAGAEAKLWVVPDVRIAESTGFDARGQAELLEIVKSNAELIVQGME